ncbi:MAG: iron ABC transporter permease [Spirochaetia bacterium]|jgi:iron complex transport system permease protein|nr:iron ABC transporter permease [Spirochaetia bacterium]
MLVGITLPKRVAGRESRARLALAILALVVVSALALLFGRYPKPGFMDPRILFDDPLAWRILVLVRLPRTLAALLLGAALGASGAALQFVFANPLVDAGFLGVSQGASFGAALVLVAGGGSAALFGSAFGFAILALVMSVLMSSRIRFGGAVLRLILSGMAVSAFFSALVALIKYGADPLKSLPEISYWLMGGLSGVGWKTLRIAAPIGLFSIASLVALRWRTALLSLDEATAASLGASPRLERSLILALAAAGVAAVTAMAGVVAWVGLVVPHLARMALKGDGSPTVPGSAIVGAIFVVISDALSRGLFPGELPLGITTSLLGTVAFFYLLVARHVNVERG